MKITIILSLITKWNLDYKYKIKILKKNKFFTKSDFFGERQKALIELYLNEFGVYFYC